MDKWFHECGSRSLIRHIDQVFYDGGSLILSVSTLPNLTLGDIPFSTGSDNGVESASHWKDLG